MTLELVKIKGIGLLHDAIGKSVPFGRVTCIFGENGRGKSTLSSILTSLGNGDSDLLAGRRTLDGTNEPEVGLKIDGTFHEFKNLSWNARSADICVFDLAFIDANVYSGSEVSSDQRRSLLDFALGEQGVLLKQQVDNLTSDISVATSNIRQAEARLADICRPDPVQQYVEAKAEPDIAKKVEEARKAVGVARNAREIAEKALPTAISMPALDLSALPGLLSESLSAITAEAKRTVTAHLRGHGGSPAEGWVKEGIARVEAQSCPFCGQPLGPAQALLDAYATYFDESYSRHLEALAALRRDVEDSLGDAHLVSLNRCLGDNEVVGEFWKPLADVQLPASPADQIAERTRKARTLLVGLIDLKIANPLQAIADPAGAVTAAVSLQDNALAVAEYNSGAMETNVAIGMVQTQAESSNLASATSRLDALERQRLRHESPNKDECDRYTGLVEQKKKLGRAKATARRQLEQFTRTLLANYEAAINGYLKDFDAGFQIVDVRTSNERGLPRVDYALQLRRQTIALRARGTTPSRPVFRNILSDGDRRTLALSFFMARLQVDGKLAQQLVVVDDPVSSLDQSRRRATGLALNRLAGEAKQLIVLSHDPVFIQTLSDDREVQKLGVTVLELRRSALDYVILDTCDIEERVQSEYKANYATIVEYTTKGDLVDRQRVVRAIRPMLEANLRHRFQASLKGASSLGKMIEAIRTCKPEDTLEGMKLKLQDLTQVNDYATAFTHDTEADGSLQQLDDAQLLKHARLALAIARGT